MSDVIDVGTSDVDALQDLLNRFSTPTPTFNMEDHVRGKIDVSHRSLSFNAPLLGALGWQAPLAGGLIWLAVTGLAAGTPLAIVLGAICAGLAVGPVLGSVSNLFHLVYNLIFG